MTHDVFLCFECGQRNRVSSDADRGLAKCGKCGAALFPGNKTEAVKSTSYTKKNSPKPSETRQNRTQAAAVGRDGVGVNPFFRLMVFLLLGIGLYWLFSEPDVSNTTRSRGHVESAPSTPPPPVGRPESGVISNWTGRVPQAPLAIITSPGSDYYIKLVDVETGHDAVAIYVRGGRKTQVDVPLGNYRIKYASGETWRGFAHLFGPNEMTRYSEAQSTFKFQVSGGYISGYTVELIRQSGGNLQTRSIDRSKF